MATQTTLELTEVESKLSALLSDVATYIEPNAPSELRYTGGWVRDKVLGVGSHDIDVAINNMTGYQFGLRMKEYLDIPGNAEKYGVKGLKATGLHKIEANPEKSKHLETVTTRIFNLDIDLVNLRKETYTEESRTPQMEFGTAEEDALRRDATINALFYNLQTKLVEDLTNRGMQDMVRKVLRTPLEPYQTFKDDPLRVLRLIRFASRLGFTVEDDVRAAMGDETIKEALKFKISRERVGVELEKMLKGDDPQSALTLIAEVGLYRTIFTDPTTDVDYSPDIEIWRRSYGILSSLISSDSCLELRHILMPNRDDEYTAWLLTAFVPWFDAPLPAPAKHGGKAPTPAAVLAAREGVKANNKMCEVIGLSVRNAEEVLDLKTQFLQKPNSASRYLGREGNAAGRDTLGMAIRRWGSTWKSQAMYALMLEITRSTRESSDICKEWSNFLGHIKKLDLLAAYEFKPVIDGKALAKALDARPGPWMKDALDVIMAWQLRNPERATTEGAIDAVRNKQGELAAVLIRHFLQLTIRPLFAKTQTQPNVTAQGRKATGTQVTLRKSLDSAEDGDGSRPWKHERESHALELLKWTVWHLDEKLAEQNWPLLIPPILTLLDDTEIKFKAFGCELVSALLRATSPALLSRTGLGEVFQDAIEPSLSYLPTLTPERESITILNHAYPAMLDLGRVRFPTLASEHSSRQHVSFLTTLLHAHLLTSISHVSEEHPLLTSTLLVHTRSVLDALQTDTISQLMHLFSMLTALMTTPFIAVEPVLLLESTITLQSVIANAWPRVWFWRGEIFKGLCVGWLAVADEKERWERVADNREEGEELAILEKLGTVAQELRKTAAMVMASVESMTAASLGQGERYQGIDMDHEVAKLVEAEPKLAGLFSSTDGPSTH